METRVARSAIVRMDYKGQDISEHCTDVVFTSNAAGAFDDISITIQDRDGRIWQGEKWPTRGDILRPIIITKDWIKLGDRSELDCGEFELDMPTVDGPPDVVNLRGTSVKLKSSSQTEKKSNGWENVTLQDIAGDIAKRNGYELKWRGKNKNYLRLDQRFQSDLSYLERLAREAGNGVRVEGKTIHVIDYVEMENEPASFVFSRLDKSVVVRFRWCGQVYEKYKACSVAWHDTVKGERFSGVYNDPTVPSGETLVVVDKYAESSADAELIAKQLLLAKNRNNMTGTLTVVGNTKIKGGMTCEVTEFGGYSGKYLITSATHSPLNGYEVSLQIQGVS